MKKIILFFSIIVILMLPQPIWANTVSGTITMEFDLSSHSDRQETQLWIPYPTSDQNQNISNIQVRGNYQASGVYTDRVHETPMLYARWDAGIKARKLTFTFTAERREIDPATLPDRVVAWDPADYAPYLAATRLGPIDGEVKKLAERITAGQTSVLGKAKALYDWTCENTYRNPATRGCGIGDVHRLLQEPGGKCADISSIFVALARAAGVPAREIFGIRQGKKDGEDISQWQHCWAEFYLPGYGWVSVDPADVRKMMLVQNLILTDSKTVQYRKYFWGGLDPYRVKLGQGRDVQLNPPQSGEPVNYLMYPYAQIGDKTLDWLDPATFKYTITYKQKRR
jgi:transglutaminase-like putative cysteine protease